MSRCLWPPGVAAPLAALLAAALVTLQPVPAGGVWELEQLWVEDIREYVEPYTGDLDDKGTAIDTKFLKFEQTGWYQKLYDRTSVGMDKVRRSLSLCARARSRRTFPPLSLFSF